jgi:hypothetical protein
MTGPVHALDLICVSNAFANIPSTALCIARACLPPVAPHPNFLTREIIVGFLYFTTSCTLESWAIHAPAFFLCSLPSQSVNNLVVLHPQTPTTTSISSSSPLLTYSSFSNHSNLLLLLLLSYIAFLHSLTTTSSPRY